MKLNVAQLFLVLGMNQANVQLRIMKNLKLNVNWSINTLNDYLYPTEGVNNSLSAGIALPFGDYRYFNVKC